MGLPSAGLAVPPYVTLVASLPALDDPFIARQTPLSRLRLEVRLRALAPADRRLLEEILDLLAWRRLGRDETDAALAARARALLPRLPDPTLRRAVMHRMEMRTVVAALRRRARGEGPPPAGEVWGSGRWSGTIRRSWTDPALGVSHSFPWVREAAELLAREDTLGLERLLITEAWRTLGRLGVGHDFDLAAVVLYCLRFELVERRVTWDAGAAAGRFAELVAAGLGERAMSAAIPTR
jgi:hypothetical protein